MPYYPYWKITWPNNLGFLLDYYQNQELSNKAKKQVKITIDDKILLFVYLSKSTSKSKISCRFTRASLIEDSNRKEFEEAEASYLATDPLDNHEGEENTHNFKSKKSKDPANSSEEANKASLTKWSKDDPTLESYFPQSSQRKKVHFDQSVESHFVPSDPWPMSQEDSRSTIDIEKLYEKRTEKTIPIQEPLSKESLILRIMSGETVNHLVQECKRDKNIEMFSLIHENFERLKSMEALLKNAENDEGYFTPKSVRSKDEIPTVKKVNKPFD